MIHRTAVTRVLLAVLCIAIAPALACAQAIPAACRPLVDARKKQIMTPYHAYATEGQGAGATTHESISTGGITYIQYRGQWRRSPLTPQAALEQLQENLADAKGFSCQVVGDETVAGVPATVYTSHEENDDIKADARTWVAKGSVLVLRTEEDLDTGGPLGKRHISIRYEYANVRAPAGVR